MLNEREVYWISQYDSTNCGYNVSIGGDGYKKYNDSCYIDLWNSGLSIIEIHEQTGIDRGYIGKRLRELGISPQDIEQRGRASKKIHNGKTVYQYDLLGNYVGLYNSAYDAGCVCNPKTIYACASGKIPSAGGFQWRYEKKENIGECVLSRCGTAKQVFQYSLDGDYIKSFESVAQAAAEVGQHVSNVAAACKGKQKSCAGYMWRYERYDKIDQLQQNNFKAKSVEQYLPNGIFIESYHSITEASKRTGIDISNISSACNGKQKTAGGFVWKFNEKEVA